MKIEVDLDFLKEKNLSPTEFVILTLIKEGINDFQNEVIIKSLTDKGYLVDGYVTISLSNKVSCKQWIDKWLSLWPTQIINSGTTTYRVSGNKNEVINRMNRFIKEHPEYNDEIVLKATENYLDQRKKENYKYTKKNTKFIRDIDGSTLEAECEAVLSGEEKPKDNVRYI